MGPLRGEEVTKARGETAFVYTAMQPRAPELNRLWLYCSAAAVIIQTKHSGYPAYQHSFMEERETQEIDNPPEMSPP